MFKLTKKIHVVFAYLVSLVISWTPQQVDDSQSHSILEQIIIPYRAFNLKSQLPNDVGASSILIASDETFDKCINCVDK